MVGASVIPQARQAEMPTLSARSNSSDVVGGAGLKLCQAVTVKIWGFVLCHKLAEEVRSAYRKRHALSVDSAAGLLGIPVRQQHDRRADAPWHQDANHQCADVVIGAGLNTTSCSVSAALRR